MRVGLAATNQPVHLPIAVLALSGPCPETGVEPARTLAAHLGGGNPLVLFDNCEHPREGTPNPRRSWFGAAG